LFFYQPLRFKSPAYRPNESSRHPVRFSAIRITERWRIVSNAVYQQCHDWLADHILLLVYLLPPGLQNSSLILRSAKSGCS
jgi:hypothetical protein